MYKINKSLLIIKLFDINQIIKLIDFIIKDKENKYNKDH
jgi:hypothetical protein